MHFRLCVLFSLLLPLFPAFGAEEGASLETIHQIKTEAFDDSQVMDTLSWLSDVNGPRLTASPQFTQAAEWAMSRLKSYGLTNVHGEEWGPFGRSWSLTSYTLDMETPRYSHLAAVPLAWSSSLEPKTADAMFAPVPAGSTYDLKKNKESFEKYKTEWTGKLRGKIVLITPVKKLKPGAEPLFHRYSEAELMKIGEAPAPQIRRNIPVDALEIPEEGEAAREYLNSLPPATMDKLWDEYSAFAEARARFFREQGAVAVIRSDDRAHDGLDFAEAAGSEKAANPMAVPTFVVTEEQYSRMTRLLALKQPVTIKVGLQAKASNSDVDGLNIVGEIPGTKKPDEIVMVGAHFDSWHSGVGATDNGAGSAVMIETMRILKKLNIKLERTVRIGLWSGEEQGLYGSKAYVKAHFADPTSMQPKAEHAKLAGYLNLDNGSGKIRGVYLEGNDAVRPLFEKWMMPFKDLGVSMLTLKHTGGTDHESFDAVGLPGFQFIQDPLDYGTITHHSNMDTYDHAIDADLMQASAVIATLVCDIANREEKLPRKPLPPAAKS